MHEQDVETISERISRAYRPAVHRLGIVSIGVGGSMESVIDSAIAAAGLPPARRHARLAARHDPARRRIDDLIVFAERYGHEYSVAVFSRRHIDAADRPALDEAFARAGLAVIWI